MKQRKNVEKESLAEGSFEALTRTVAIISYELHGSFLPRELLVSQFGILKSQDMRTAIQSTHHTGET